MHRAFVEEARLRSMRARAQSRLRKLALVSFGRLSDAQFLSAIERNGIILKGAITSGPLRMQHLYLLRNDERITVGSRPCLIGIAVSSCCSDDGRCLVSRGLKISSSFRYSFLWKDEARCKLKPSHRREHSTVVTHSCQSTAPLIAFV